MSLSYNPKELHATRKKLIPKIMKDTTKLDFDFPILIVGKEGMGKSTYALLLADLINRVRNKVNDTNNKLEIDKLVYYDLETLTKDIFRNSSAADVRIIDEGAITGGYKRNAMTKDNRKLNQTLMTCRSRNQVLLFLIPNIAAVDRELLDRVKCVIRVVARGHAWIYHDKDIASCIKWDRRARQMKFKQRPANHLEKYRNVQTILGNKIWEDYVNHKEISLRGDDPDLDEDNKTNWLSPKQVYNKYPIKKTKLIKLRNDGKIEYSFIGNKYIYNEQSIMDYFRLKQTDLDQSQPIVGYMGGKRDEK